MDDGYSVGLSKTAMEDLRAIVAYIAYQRKEPINATKIHDAIEESIRSLSIMPERHPKVRDYILEPSGIRMFSVKGYLVFYLIIKKKRAVRIVRIMHAKREWSDIL